MSARARRRHGRRQAGFTMLEVVLAMSLLAMVTALIYAAFHLGIRSVEKGQNAVVSAQRARAANDVIRRQLKSMFPYPCVAGGDDDTPMPFFNLRENPPMMEFVTAAGMHGGGGLEFVRYEVRGNPPQLVLTALPMLGFEEGRCGSIERVIRRRSFPRMPHCRSGWAGILRVASAARPARLVGADRHRPR